MAQRVGARKEPTFSPNHVPILLLSLSQQTPVQHLLHATSCS